MLKLDEIRKGIDNIQGQLGNLTTPRTLTGAQFTQSVERLKPFKGTPYYLYVCNDEEAERFSTIIRNALFQAGWTRKDSLSGGIPLAGFFDLHDGGPPIPIPQVCGFTVLHSACSPQSSGHDGNAGDQCCG